MSQTCSICRHSARSEIEKDIVTGIPLRTIAERYQASKTALIRHRKSHLSGKITQAAEEEDRQQAIDIIQQLKAINSTTVGILSEARQRGNAETALKAVDRIHRQLELQAKLLGELDDRPAVSVTLSPQWMQIRTVILNVLAPYPQAKVAVAEALEEVL